MVDFLYRSNTNPCGSQDNIAAIYHTDTESLIADARYGFIAGALKETYRPGAKKDSFTSVTQRLDRVLTHRFFGFPIFLFFISCTQTGHTQG